MYNSLQMQAIRQGLEAGLDVPQYATLGGDGKPVYDSYQMEEIRQGLEAGLDISQYTMLGDDGKPVYDSWQMAEIRQGLEAGLDVPQEPPYMAADLSGMDTLEQLATLDGLGGGSTHTAPADREKGGQGIGDG